MGGARRLLNPVTDNGARDERVGFAFPLAHDIGEDVQGVGGVAGVLAMPTNSVQRVPRPRNVWCSAWVGGELALWHTGARGLSEGVSDSRFFHGV